MSAALRYETLIPASEIPIRLSDQKTPEDDKTSKFPKIYLDVGHAHYYSAGKLRTGSLVPVLPFLYQRDGKRFALQGAYPQDREA